MTKHEDTTLLPAALRLSDGLGPAVEQALYSLIATADDESDDGNRDRAKLLHACASTLGAELQRLRAALALIHGQSGKDFAADIFEARAIAREAMAGPNVKWTA